MMWKHVNNASATVTFPFFCKALKNVRNLSKTVCKFTGVSIAN